MWTRSVVVVFADTAIVLFNLALFSSVLSGLRVLYQSNGECFSVVLAAGCKQALLKVNIYL